MTIRFGVSPIAWINDDMPELGGDTPLSKVLGDARDIGFTGIELGGKFPRDPARLQDLLDEYGLELVGGWYSASLLTRGAADEIAAMADHLSLLQNLGCSVFIVAETSNAIHGRQDISLGQSPQMESERWQEFGEHLTSVADHVASSGMRLAYHHHLGTVVESQAELDRFLECTGASVGLTLDTGHAALGGIDPVAVIRAMPERIAHVHCKDVRNATFNALNDRGGSFLDGVLDGMFTVPGDGSLDYVEIMQALADIKYAGWVVVEAEQDPAVADPRIFGEIGLATLKDAAARAGLRQAA